MDFFLRLHRLFSGHELRSALFQNHGYDGQKLAVIAKSRTRLILFGTVIDNRITSMIEAGTVTHHPRLITLADMAGASFAYLAADDYYERNAAIAVFSWAGLP